MSMSADIHDTILSFCIAKNIPQDEAIALLREIVDDMNGDGDSYDFSFVANVYASEQARHPAPHALDGDCSKCGAEGYVILGDGRKYCNVCKTPRR